MATPIRAVHLESVPEDNNMMMGKYPPQRVMTEVQDTTNMLIRSDDRSYGNDFDFQIDLLTSTSGIRKIQLSKCIFPLLPQINVNNKSITITHDDGSISFDLIEGYYSVQSLTNMIQAEFTTAWQTLDITNAVTVSYDIDRRSISITDDNAENFFIHSESPFAIYGRNIVDFPTEPSGSTPSVSSIESLSLGMIYSRYVTLKSNRLTQDQKAFSVVSKSGPSDIVAIIDLASQYTSDQFLVSASFPGTIQVVDTLNYAPRINTANRFKSFKVIDFQFIDEFGFCVSSINTSTYKFEYPVAIWFQCYL
jgi:hypothetical protein